MTIRDFFNTGSLKLTLSLPSDDSKVYAEFNVEDIIKDSITFEGKLMNNTDSSSNVVKITVKESEKVDRIIGYEGELKATLSANNMVVYKGYYSNKTSFSVNTYGIPSVQLTLEDIGTRVFKRELYPDKLTDTFFTGTLKDFIDLIVKSLNYTITYDDSVISSDSRTLSKLIDSDDTIEDLLKAVCAELGYVYYWNVGVLTFFKIPHETTSSEDVEALAVNGDNAIQVSKQIRKYKTSRVTCTTHETAVATIFRDNSGSDSSSGCNVVIKPGEHYPPYSDSGEPSQYECEDLDTGKELVNIESLQPIVTYIAGIQGPTVTITKSGATSILVDIYNPGSADITITRLECKANVTRVNSTEVIKSTIGTIGSESNNVYELSCDWIHSKDDAESIAKTLSAFYGYCDTQYLFYTKDELESSVFSPFAFIQNSLVGKIVNLRDTTISGMDVNVLVTNASINTSTGVIKYQGYGYSRFSLDSSIITNKTQGQNTNSKGSDGIGIKSIISYYLATNKNEGVTIDDEGWTDKPQATSAEKKYLWIYTVTTYTDDETTTSTPYIAGMYAETAKLCTLSSNKSCVIKNLRLDTSQTITLYVTVQGYTSEPVLKVNGRTVTLSGYSYSVSIPYATADSITAIVYIDGEEKEVLILPVVDETEYNLYLGKFATVSDIDVDAFEGDGVFITEENLLYAYSNGSWVTLSSSTLSNELKSRLAGQAQKDILDMVEKGSTLSSDYAYLSNVISNTVTTSVLTMTEEGIIQSEGITSSSVGSDGYLTKDGYRLEGKTPTGSGVLRAKRAYINDFNASNVNMTNATISGEIKGRYINTVAPSSSSTSLYISTQYAVYENSEVRQWLCTQLGGQATSSKAVYTYDVKGSVHGFSIDGYTICTKNKQWGSPDGVEGYDFKYLTHDVREWNLLYYHLASDTTDFISYADQKSSDRKTFYPDGTTYRVTDTSHRVIVKLSDGTLILDTADTPLQYVTVTSSMTNQFKGLSQNVAYSCYGTVRGGGQEISGSMTLVRNVDSTTFTQSDTSITIPDSGKYYGGNLYVSVSYNITRSGISVGSIYANSSGLTIGESSRYFSTGYISTLNSSTVNASTVYGSTISGDTVWGAVAN